MQLLYSSRDIFCLFVCFTDLSFSGVGKTTIICKICEKLKNCGTQAKGFYTQEIRLQGKRSGFDVLTLDGKRGSLARIR